MKSKHNSKPSFGSYITIQTWMVSKLELKGDELLIFAIIYGFSQDGISSYKGSTRYLSFWTGKSKETVLKNLKSLRMKKLIERKKKPTSKANLNRYLCDYWATISRFPQEEREKIINNWSNFSACIFPQEDE